MHSACGAPALEPTCALASRRPRRNKYVLESPLRDERPADHTGGGASGKNWTSPSTDPKHGTEAGTRTAALPWPVHAEAAHRSREHARRQRPEVPRDPAAGRTRRAWERDEHLARHVATPGGKRARRPCPRRLGIHPRRRELRSEAAHPMPVSLPRICDVRAPLYTHALRHTQALATRARAT
ncbi:hypothetical protein B0H10DRAFT_2229429 [Mycena sp. CBHHK59/15]|nr:hypothetical protein B0H10DRAFT_2229429 [Mycena sp. CBHHK59/15]